MRPTSVDDVPASRRLVSTSIAARNLHRARNTITRWVGEDKLTPAACALLWPKDGPPVFGGHLFWQLDIYEADRQARIAAERTRFAHSA